MTQAAQRAVGVLAARKRNDPEGAEALLSGFASDGQRAFGFFAVSELLLALLADAAGEPAEELCQDLSLTLAGLFERRAG